MLKGAPLLVLAIFIDLLQIGVSISLFALGAAAQASTPVGGGVAGAVAGCYANASAWFDVTGCLKGALVGAGAGAAVATFGVPFGIALGFAINVCISLTLGTGLVALAAMLGLFSWRLVGGFLEVLPGINNGPVWTIAVAWTLVTNFRKKKSKPAEGSGSTSTPTTPPNIDGIRATSDNQLHAAAA